MATGKVTDGAELKRYWTVGKGGLKIRWGTPGSFTRCVREIRKYAVKEGFSAEGYCARLHHEMEGTWPGSKQNVGGNGRSKKGK